MMTKQPASVVQHRPWSEIEDHGLLQRIAGANKQAFTELARRHMPVMLGFARRYVSGSDAEDIVQETLTRVWLKAGQWQDRGVSPRSWIMRIVYNLCMDNLRSERWDTEPTTDELKCSAATPERAYEHDCRQHQLTRALQALPERQRSAIFLTVYHTMSNRETAAVLKVSVEALESLLSRGRKRLKEIIKQQGES
jgi:RNA polymerase sigma-70 factor (ECF subfamily)